MTIRASLFGADGAETAYDILKEGIVDKDGRRLVWIDVDTGRMPIWTPWAVASSCRPD